MVARIIRNRRGSTLILVIVVFALLIIFATAALALASNSQLSSVADYQSQQAYFTARSSVLAAVDYFKQNPKEIDNFVNATGNAVNPSLMGDYALKVEKFTNYYRISSTATFQGKSRRYFANLVKESGSTPFIGLAIATGRTGDASALQNESVYCGDIYVNKRADGKPTALGSFNLVGNLIADDSIIFDKKFSIEKGTDKSGKTIGGNVYIRKNATFKDQTTIQGDVYVLNTVNIPTSNITLQGFLYAGEVSPQKIVSSSIPANFKFPEMPMSTPEEINKISLTPPSGETISNTEPHSTNKLGDKWIDGNGTFTSSTLCRPASDNSFRSIIFDTSAGDLYIKLEPGTYDYSSQMNGGINRDMRVEGSHRVYLYFDDASSPVQFSISGSGSIFGDSSAVKSNFFAENAPSWRQNWSLVNHVPKVTIIASNPNSFIKSTTNGNIISAYIYMPNSSIDFTNNTKFCGSFFVSNLKIATQCCLAYIPPEKASPPLPKESTPTAGIKVQGLYSGQPAAK